MYYALRSVLWLSVLYVLQPIAGYGQEKRSLLFNQLSPQDGLPHPSVWDVMPDDQGFIWIGCQTGIVRFDGQELVQYPIAGQSPNQSQLRYPNFLQDRNGELWVGFMAIKEEKIHRYIAELDAFLPYPMEPDPQDGSYPIKDGVHTLFEGSGGRLYVGSSGLGLYIIDKSDLQCGRLIAHYPPDKDRPEASPGGDVTDLYEDEEGIIWMTTSAGLYAFDPETETFSRYSVSVGTGFWDNFCWALHDQPPHTLWIATHRSGLLRFDLKQKAITRQYVYDPARPNGMPGYLVGGITSDRQGRLWMNVLTAITGVSTLLRFDPDTERFTEIRSRQGQEEVDFTLGTIADLTTDRQGNIWLGAWKGGVFWHNTGQEAFQLSPQGSLGLATLKHIYQSGIEEDRRGGLWISTSHGLFHRPKGSRSFDRYTYANHTDPGIPNHSFYNVVEGKDGAIYVLMQLALLRFDPSSGSFTVLCTNENETEHPFFGPMLCASDGRIWFTQDTPEQIGCFDPARPDEPVLFFREETGAFGLIAAMAEDPEGNIWLGENIDGLHIYDIRADTFRHFRGLNAHDIAFDRAGRGWIATHSEGLKIFDPATGEAQSLPPELDRLIGQPENMIRDQNGHFWILNQRCLIQFDPIEGRILAVFPSSNWHSHTKKWIYTQPPKLLTRAGEVYFNTRKGWLHFHPDHIRRDSTPPPLVFTHLSVNDRELKAGQGPLQVDISRTSRLRLAHDENNLALTFAGLHYKIPAENRFQYKLEPYESRWREAGSERTARYTSLPPGRYRFLLRGANADGFWTPAGAEKELFITIAYPWYGHPIAYGIYLLLAAGFLYWLYRLQLRRRLAQAEAERVREMDQFKSRFYTNITHEFRTPLTLILGQAEEVKARADRGLRSRLLSIERHGRHLLRLVNQLLDLARLESGGLRLQPVQADVVPFLSYLTDAFHSAAEAKAIALRFEPGDSEIVLDYDPERLQQVVGNLLSNAVKFTPEQGEVLLACRRLTAGEVTAAASSPVSEWLEIRVSDTGPGIPPEQLDRIFDRFFQTETAESRGGSGIGLALARELVQLMGGALTADSRPGRGSTFRLFLPIRREAPPARPEPMTEAGFFLAPPARQPEPAVEPAGDDRPLLLLVEDHPELRSYLRELLEADYRLLEAENGRTGLQKARAEVPDLIISDVMMPEMDGYALCRTLKDDLPTSHIPIILLTARADAESRLQGLERGADAYLAKPFAREELLLRVRKLIEGRRKLQAYYRSLLGDPAPAAHALPAEEAPAEAAFVVEARQAVENHLDDPDFGPEQLERALAVSRTQLYRKLKNLTGYSASRFIRHIRLQHARRKLLTSQANISEIAYDCGFSDAGYFGRVFREAFGLSPSRFRAQHRSPTDLEP